MRYILMIIVFLFTSVGYGKEFTVQSSIPAYQPMMENSKASINPLSSIKRQERSYIDTADDEQKTISKPEKKRNSVGRTFLSVLCIMFVAVAIYLASGDWDGLI
jgi:hypothetical protein